jgi:DNA processing protein
VAPEAAEAAAPASGETDARLKLPSLFWQRFLAAEMTAEKGRALLERLDPSSIDPVADLDAFEFLTPSERKRMRSASESALYAAEKGGIRVFEADSIPGVYGQSPISPALFIDGSIDCLAAPTVAIVGTRAASTYGKAVAEKFAEALARAGVTVVSGGALGIDAAAHRGALNVGGATVAVLAGGVDRVYPSVHAGLFRQVRESGCLVSQFPVGAQPLDYRFLERNRLIAALSLGVLVIEAPARSGALRTAHEAADLGREVFVVPANIDNLKFKGSFNLIRDGATLVDHPYQILESLGLESSPAGPVPAPASGVGQRIMAVLSVQPLAAEFIVERTGLPAAEILSELTMLELEGRVIRDAGGYALRP